MGCTMQASGLRAALRAVGRAGGRRRSPGTPRRPGPARGLAGAGAGAGRGGAAAGRGGRGEGAGPGRPRRGLAAGPVATSTVMEGVAPGTVPSEAYAALAAAGQVTPDPGQVRCLELLDGVFAEVQGLGAAAAAEAAPSSSSSSFWGLFGGGAAAPAKPPRGMYIQGGVGCGKTFCMSIFYECVDAVPKLQTHFHSFMLDVHQRLYQIQKGGIGTSGQDPLPQVAQAIAEEARLLCLDEFQVTDVADALILRRLLESLTAHGVVLVTTSNRMPDELYLNGINRAQFLPAIDLLKECCEVYPYDEAAADYRLLGSLTKTWLAPLDAETEKTFEAKWARLTKGRRVKSGTLEVSGRAVKIPRKSGGVARFAFEEICGIPAGAGDYLAIAGSYHTVFLDQVPVSGPSHPSPSERRHS